MGAGAVGEERHDEMDVSKGQTWRGAGDGCEQRRRAHLQPKKFRAHAMRA